MNDSARKTLEAAGHLVLRVSVSLLFLFGHGWAKLAGWAEKSATFPDPLHVGSRLSFALVIFAEVVCSALVAAGLLTRLAAVPPVIMMFVAFFVQHAADPFARRELAMLYGLAFVAILLLGPGEWSLDGLLRRRREGRKGKESSRIKL